MNKEQIKYRGFEQETINQSMEAEKTFNKLMNTNQTKEEIRKIWDEIKELKILIKKPDVSDIEYCRMFKLNEKYEEIETLFGHESTLSKAIIYYLSQNK